MLDFHSVPSLPFNNKRLLGSSALGVERLMSYFILLSKCELNRTVVFKKDRSDLHKSGALSVPRQSDGFMKLRLWNLNNANPVGIG